jgi:hypothetical protein
MLTRQDHFQAIEESVSHNLAAPVTTTVLRGAGRSPDPTKRLWALIRSPNCAIIGQLGVQVMMKLIDCKTSVFNSLASNHAMRESHAGNSRYTPAEEPLRVHVRVRQYGVAPSEARRTCPAGPDPRRLPVGSILDCYI